MRFVLLAGFSFGAVALSACGSSVTTGTGGNNAGGSADTGPASGAGAGTGVSSGSGASSASTGPGGGPPGCEQACAHLAMLGCAEASCADECKMAYASDPRCAAQLDEVVKCVAVATSCDLDGCGEQVAAYSECIAGSGCGPAECRGEGSSGGQTACSCFAVCNGLEVSADCSSFDGSDAKCECYQSGMFIGGCVEPASLACDLELGCCSEFL